MPVKFSGCTSLSQSGGMAGLIFVAPVLAAPGVTLTTAGVITCGGKYMSGMICGCTLVLIWKALPGKVRRLRLVALVLAKNQQLTVQVTLLSAPAMNWCTDELRP